MDDKWKAGILIVGIIAFAMYLSVMGYNARYVRVEEEKAKQLELQNEQLRLKLRLKEE